MNNNQITCKSRIPTSKMLKLLGLAFIAALIHSFLLGSDASWVTDGRSLIEWFWRGLILLSFCLVLFDYLLAREKPQLSIERHNHEILPLHRFSEMKVTIAHKLQKPTQIALKELIPATLEVSHDVFNITLLPGQVTQLEYQMRANQRGDAHIDGLEIIMPSPLGLWQSVYRIDSPATLKVYPDFQTIQGFALMALDNKQSNMGIKKVQKRGEGMEFHQLREYMRGDTSRQIDWKATARKQKLISRDYQDERDQQIIVLLDNGRRMRNHNQQLGHLDHSVNAMALLSHIALKQGDAVGLMSFGQQQKWLPGKKGTAHLNTILNHVYDLQPELHATDYSTAAQKLLKLQRKRSMVILITNTRDEDIDDLLPAIKLINKSHLVLLANIIEPDLQQVMDTPVDNVEQLYRYCGTAEYLSKRDKIRQKLSEQGIFVIDALPQDLPVRVCNSYLEIKRSGYL